MQIYTGRMRGLAPWLDDSLLVLLELSVEGSLSFVSTLPAQAPHYAYSSIGSLRVPLSPPWAKGQAGVDPWSRPGAVVENSRGSDFSLVFQHSGLGGG